MLGRIASGAINRRAHSLRGKTRSYSWLSSSPSSPVNAWAMNVFRFGAFTALTGAGIAAYASYAYTLEEVNDKTKWLRQPTPFVVQNDTPTYEKFRSKLFAVAKSATAKSIDHYLDFRKLVEEQIKEVAEPLVNLPDVHPDMQRVPTLVLDLDETLIYTEWKRERGWRTFKRPGLDYFLQQLSQFYEIIIYSDRQDMELERYRPKFNVPTLGRSATMYQNGQHYRDLSKLRRDPSRIIYISGRALENCLQPENSVPIKAWNLEADDTALLDLVPFLQFVALHRTINDRPIDVRTTLASYKNCDIPSEFAKHRMENQRRMLPGSFRLWQK